MRDYRNKVVGVPRPCALCGRTFTPISVGNKYCSYRCRVEAYGRMRTSGGEDGAAVLSARERRKRLEARDAAYASAFPADAGGDVRGRKFAGAVGCVKTDAFERWR